MVSKRLVSIILALLIAMLCCVYAVAERTETVLSHEESGITVKGVFPGETELLIDSKSIKDNPLCEEIINITMLTVCEHGDADSYDGYNGVTISIPYDKADRHVIGFDYEGNPIDTKAKYQAGKYVFSSNNIGDGTFWITEPALTDNKVKTKYQQLKDSESGVVVKGYFPENSYLLVQDITDRQIENEADKKSATYFNIKVYNQFKEVSPEGTIRVEIPYEKGDRTVLLQMTNDQLLKLTDQQDNADINYFDRRWFDVVAKYKGGRYVFDASRVGDFIIATDGYIENYGGGIKRVAPPKEDISPFSPPMGKILVYVAAVVVLLAAIAIVVVKRKKKA